MSDAPKATLPARLWRLGICIVVLYTVVVGIAAVAAWQMPLATEETAWARVNDVIGFAGGVATVIVAALGGFLAQEPAKERIRSDLRIVGSAFQDMEQNRLTDQPGDTALREKARQILAGYGV